MKHEIDLKWKENMQFEADLNGYKVAVDAPTQAGGDGQGAGPKKLMLVAVAGCTGMDVVSLFKKMRVQYDTLNIKVEANLTEEHPKVYDTMKLVYEITGDKVDASKAEKAINLSMEKYCGVSAMYKKIMDFEFEIRINP